MAFRPGVVFRRNDGTWAKWVEQEPGTTGTVRHTDGKYYKLTPTDENGVPTGGEGPTREGGTPSIPAPAPPPNPSIPAPAPPPNPSRPAPAPQPNPSRPADSSLATPGDMSGAPIGPQDLRPYDPVTDPALSPYPSLDPSLATPGDTTIYSDPPDSVPPTILPGPPVPTGAPTGYTLDPPEPAAPPDPTINVTGATTSPITAPAGNAGQYGGPTTDFWSRDWQTPVQGTADMGGPHQAPLGNIQNTPSGSAIAHGGQHGQQEMIYQNSVSDGTNPVAGNPWRPPGPGPGPYEPQQSGGGRVYPGGGSPTNTGMPPQSGQPTVGHPYQTFPNPQQPQQPRQLQGGLQSALGYRQPGPFRRG